MLVLPMLRATLIFALFLTSGSVAAITLKCNYSKDTTCYFTLFSGLQSGSAATNTSLDGGKEADQPGYKLGDFYCISINKQNTANCKRLQIREEPVLANPIPNKPAKH